MDTFIKLIAVILVAAILSLLLSQKSKEFSLLLTLVLSCIVLFNALQYFSPVLDFFRDLQQMGGLDADIMQILLKSVGIGLIAEIVSLICKDIGNATLGTVVQISSVAVILWLSLPLFTSLLNLLREILEKV